MKPSKYNLYVEHDGKIAIYNILQRSLAKIPQRIHRDLLDSPDKLTERDVSTFQTLGFLVDEKSDEINLFRMHHESIIQRAETLSVTLLLTNRCNCKCLYCYEEGYRKEEGVSSEDTDFNPGDTGALLEFVLEMVNSLSLKKVDFSFHGGEPSLRVDLIRSLSTAVSDALRENGTEVRFSMVTNGTLIDGETLNALIDSGLDRLLFSLDGASEIHNFRRPFVSGDGTFDCVYTNMKVAVERGMKVYLGINIDKHNFNSLDPLLHRLAEDFGNNENLQVIFAFVTPGKEAGAFCSNYCFSPSDDKSSAMIDLYMKAHSLGLNTADPMGSPYCTARAITDIIISPEGGVYKCTSLTGQEESFVGTIFQGSDPIIKASAEFVYGWNSYEYNEQCKECKFMPMCLGGCVEQSLLAGRRRTCQKAFFTDFLPKVISFRLDKRT